MGKSTERTNAHQDATAETLTGRGHGLKYNSLIIRVLFNEGVET